jgi:hypothetical protein
VKSIRTLLVRWIALLALIVWVGGFTFYSAVVIPILHDSFGSVAGGHVTRQVTEILNAVGVGSLVWWWGMAWLERSTGTPRANRVRVGLLAGTSMIQVGLLVLHEVMEQRLDGGSLRGFYELHRAYLIASTAQWVANLALVAVSLWIWESSAGTGAPTTAKE